MHTYVEYVYIYNYILFHVILRVYIKSSIHTYVRTYRQTGRQTDIHPYIQAYITYYIILYFYIISYYIVLYYIMLYYIILYYIILYCIMILYVVLLYFIMYNITYVYIYIYTQCCININIYIYICIHIDTHMAIISSCCHYIHFNLTAKCTNNAEPEWTCQHLVLRFALQIVCVLFCFTLVTCTELHGRGSCSHCRVHKLPFVRLQSGWTVLAAMDHRGQARHPAEENNHRITRNITEQRWTKITKQGACNLNNLNKQIRNQRTWGITFQWMIGRRIFQSSMDLSCSLFPIQRTGGFLMLPAWMDRYGQMRACKNAKQIISSSIWGQDEFLKTSWYCTDLYSICQTDKISWPVLKSRQDIGIKPSILSLRKRCTLHVSVVWWGRLFVEASGQSLHESARNKHTHQAHHRDVREPSYIDGFSGEYADAKTLQTTSMTVTWVLVKIWQHLQCYSRVQCSLVVRYCAFNNVFEKPWQNKPERMNQNISEHVFCSSPTRLLVELRQTPNS